MRALLVLLAFAQVSSAEFLEIRQVVEAGKGAKTYEAPRPPGQEQNAPAEKLTVSDELIVSERHLAEVSPKENEGFNVGVAVQLNEEGERRMVAATKDATPRDLRLAVIIDGKIQTAPRVMVVPLGKDFFIYTTTLEEAKQLADKLRGLIPPAATEGFQIRQVVEAGKGKQTAKLEQSGEEITLSDMVIVSGNHVTKAWKDVTEPARNSVCITLNDEGGKRLAEATKDAATGSLRLAILFDGKALSAPVVRAAPLGKDFVIELGTKDGAAALADEIVKKLKAKEGK